MFLKYALGVQSSFLNLRITKVLTKYWESLIRSSKKFICKDQFIFILVYDSNHSFGKWFLFSTLLSFWDFLGYSLFYIKRYVVASILSNWNNIFYIIVFWFFTPLDPLLMHMVHRIKLFIPIDLQLCDTLSIDQHLSKIRHQ